MMMTSPMLEHAPKHGHSQHFTTPPSGNSPSLRAKGSGHVTPLSLGQQYPQPNANASASGLTQAQAQTKSQASAPAPVAVPAQNRSYARAPPVRPYGSSLSSRTRAATAEPQGDTKRFGDLVASMVEERTRRGRRGQTPDSDQDGAAGNEANATGGRVIKSVGGSLAGSWEKERAELIVDVPVWSPGCFQDLSTLHALRDTTLSHTHVLLGYLHRSHSLASSYRLLARSTGGATRQPVGWGCIRLAPSNSSPMAPRKELKPLMRRSSTSLHSTSTNRRRSSAPVSPTSPIREKVAQAQAHDPAMMMSQNPPEHAIMDEEDEDEVEVKLKDGYISGSGTASDVDEEETADEIIMKELDRRGAKEGTAFLMTVFGQPALILT